MTAVGFQTLSGDSRNVELNSDSALVVSLSKERETLRAMGTSGSLRVGGICADFLASGGDC